MRYAFTIGIVAALLLGAAAVQEEAGEDLRSKLGLDEHIIVSADEVDWQAGPPSLPEGSEIAVLEGNPAAEGMLVMRLRFPDGYRVPPHWHPNFERVTVLDGTFRLGMGETFNEDDMQTLGAGGFTVMPPEMRHYAAAQGQTTIQITTVGPWEINYVDPADDPRGE